MHSVFPQKELDTIKKIQQQTIQVNQEKTSYLANQQMRNTLFDESHPYGAGLTQEVIEGITRENLISYYQSHWQHQPFRVFLSGKITDTEIALVDRILGHIPISDTTVSMPNHSLFPQGSSPILIEKENALQSSIRLKCILFFHKKS